MPDKKQFRQSALFISVVLSALLIIVYWYPFYPRLGTRLPSLNFMRSLALAWLMLAISRNLRIGPRVRLLLALVPLSLLLSGAVFGIGHMTHKLMRMSSSLEALSVMVFLPMIGWWPRLGRKLSWSLVTFCVLLSGWLAMRFLMGDQAEAKGFGIGLSLFPSLACNLLKAGAIYSLIALSAREELGAVSDRRWVRTACVTFCLVAFIYAFFLKYGFQHNVFLSYCCLGWNRLHVLSPVVWYITWCFIRLLRKLFTKGISWRQVFYDA